jgi:hypothetical protein
MAVAKPRAVVTRASLMPGATIARLVVPRTPISRKESMMPQTVPKSPMNGAVFAVVARKERRFSSLSVSSDMATLRTPSTAGITWAEVVASFCRPVSSL